MRKKRNLKMKTIILRNILIYFCVFSIFLFQFVPKIEVVSADSQTKNEIEQELKENVSSQLESLNFGEIEKVLSKLHGYDVKSFGSGRTDKGVHALGQVFNFESDLNMDCNQFKKGSEFGASGRIQTGSYDNDKGEKVYTTDVVIDEITFVGKKDSRPEPEYTGQPVEEEQVLNNDPFADFGESVSIDDDFLD